MGLWLLLAVFLFVYVDISLVNLLSGLIGFVPLLVLLICGSLVGLQLIRTQGIFTFLAVQEQMRKGEFPDQALYLSAIRLLIGILLFIPSVLTDFLALVLWLPVSHQFLANWLIRRFNLSRRTDATSSPFTKNEPIDVEFERKDKSQ